jgi:hypothetical protein
MRCDECGYSGEAEYGEFDDQDFPSLKQHIRCPMCLTTRHLLIASWERVKMAILYPEYCYGSAEYGKHEKVKKVVMIFPVPVRGVLSEVGIAGYSIHCPLCGWGEGGGLEPERARYLLSLQEGRKK